MDRKFLSVLLSLFFITASQCQSIETNKIDDLDNEIQVETSKEDVNPFAEVASAFMQGDKGGDLGGMLNNFIQADGGKTIGNILMGAMSQNGDATSQILSGIGSMLGNNEAGAALDPSLIGNVLSMMAGADDQTKHGPSNEALTSTIMSLIGNFLANQNQQQGGGGDQLDFGSIINMMSSFMKNSGENPAELLLSFANSFLGPEARVRESKHAEHAYLLPPLLEKAHIYFDHLKHTELYNALWRVTGAEKFYNMYATDGKFNFAKFFERLENQSFRKHWLMVVTRKLTDIIAVLTDSKMYRKYVNTGVSLFNGFLKSMDFPKSSLFDLTRPTETLTNLFNYFFKKYLSMKVDSRQYVKPAVKYVEEIISMAHKRGLLFKDGLDSRALSHKLTDTINLEIIEPLARVYRAYRFAKKEPDCDKYVMCIINQEDSNQVLSLPGLKTSLSKSASMFVSWFLSQRTGTSFWTLYSAINDEKDCSIRFLEKCNEFHVEELNVTQEYEHTEL